MGKNQAYKAMQRARVGSTAAPDDVDDGMVDGSFHTPEWHAARLASLNTSHTITWEDFKRKQKQDEARKGELEKDTDRMMREYRAQLDAERAHKLAHGTNHAATNSTHNKDKKDRDSRKRCTKKRKHSRHRSSNSSSSSSSDSSSTDDEDRESRRSKSRSKKRKKEKKHRSRSKHSRSDDDGPVPLSKFFGSLKS